jgi:flagellar hook-length control protein FliK
LPHIRINPQTKSEISVQEVRTIAKPEDIVEIAVEKFKALKLPEITELKVKLKPEDLGEITVKVILEKGQINGSIHAERREVFNMLQSQIDNLKQELKNSNVTFNNISVNISNEESFNRNNQREFSQNGQRGNRHFGGFIVEDNNISSEDGFSIIA